MTIKFNLFKVFSTAILVANASFLFAQNAIPLEDIFAKQKYRQESFNGFRWTNDGRHFTELEYVENEKNKQYIVKYSVTSNKVVDTLFNSTKLEESIAVEDYILSPNEDKILIESATEHLYRRSTKGIIYVYNLNTKSIIPLANKQKISNATFSPDGKFVAYTRDNNLFLTHIETNKEITITTNGEFNKIINGHTDWVYEEEFEFAQAFFWSPDSRKIAFYTFDESMVQSYNMQKWTGLYPEDYKFKYPKAGQKNAVVSINAYHLANQQTVKLDIGTNTDQYIPRITWTTNSDTLSIMRLNRLQNNLELLHTNVTTGKNRIAYTEKSNTYIEVNDYLHYLEDGKRFIITSEKDGYRQVYLYKNSGALIKQITTGTDEVLELVSVDEAANKLYYLAAQNNGTENAFFQIDLNGKNKKKLSTENGIHDVSMSPNHLYYLSYHSTFTKPLSANLIETKANKQIKNLVDNKELVEKLAKLKLSNVKFSTIKTSEGITLNSFTILPLDFDSTKKYPVLMYMYGGPGHQTVVNTWMGTYYLWFQHLAAQGYIVVSVDNRGTGGKGAEFKKCTYGHLGELETQDQISAARYLSTLPYVDVTRIGVWGWSYGGYMSSLCLLYGNDVFKMGVAVAPVTSWRFYDTIYSERYLKTPQENPTGYDKFSPINLADRLKGKYLLIHGTGDDNVHFQNAIAMQDALIKADKQFSTMYYPNRAHGISGGNSRLHVFKTITEFVLKNL
ncbi:MAG: hypothetical protein RLZZ175_2460 [Bacteroidota bacterium]|jgi:dipeptidyl-peptidase-4